ncbi:MAG: alginate export family protein [Halioglobus sp.]|nr:alginate export family protein [Halioglobus sp.]
MRSRCRLILASTGVGLLLSAHASAADGLASVLSDGTWNLDFRYRTEFVEEDGFEEEAWASTLRTRLNLETGQYRGLQAFVEFSDVREIGINDFNAGAGATPDRTEFPVVADAEDTRLNQAWLGFSPHDALDVRAGRQRIKLDNDRFVGNVGWRQNEQTYDGGSLQWQRGGWRLFYSYVSRVNRIFDSDLPAGEHEHDTHLLNASFNIRDGHTVTGYLYNIEDDDQQMFSNRTVGLRYVGSTSPDTQGALKWLAEYARQVDAGGNAVDFDADYFHVRADLLLAAPIDAVVGFERLEGSHTPGKAFRTPLATLHAFNGWADRFLATPDRGLDDFYAGLGGRHGPVGWNVTWHRFDNETGGDKLGDEFDASLSVKLHETTSALFKFAHVAENNNRIAGATKFWVMLSVALPE